MVNERKKLGDMKKKAIIEYLLVIITILLMTSILLAFQVRNEAWLPGADGPFHSSRIYDAAQQIRYGNFSYFQMNYGGSQTGRIINAVYGPFFTYFLGGILLLAGTWFKFQILLDYLIFLVGGIGMYTFAKKAGASKWASLLGMLLFLITGYMGYWPIGSTFYSWGAALMPYVLMQGLKMIQNESDQINWLSLGGLMGLIGQIHLLSIIFSTLILIPFFIYGWIISKERKKLVFNLIKAIVLFMLLTANLWGAFLVLYPTNHMTPTHSYLLDVATLHIGNTARTYMVSRLVLYVIVLQLIYALWNRKKSRINTFITLEGCGFLLITSPFLPWKAMGNIFPFLSSTLQFPHRFSALAYPLIFAGVALSLTNLEKGKSFEKAIGIGGILLVIGAIGFNLRNEVRVVKQESLYFNQTSPQLEKWSRAKDLAKLIDNLPILNSEYLPMYKKIDALQISQLVNDDIYHNKTTYHKKVLSNGRLELNWQAKKSNTEQLLPIFIYSQSHLVVNGKINQIKRFNQIGMPYVKNKIGNNIAILSFQTPIWFNFLLIISILSWIGIIILLIFKKAKKLL